MKIRDEKNREWLSNNLYKVDDGVGVYSSWPAKPWKIGVPRESVVKLTAQAEISEQSACMHACLLACYIADVRCRYIRLRGNTTTCCQSVTQTKSSSREDRQAHTSNRYCINHSILTYEKKSSKKFYEQEKIYRRFSTRI